MDGKNLAEKLLAAQADNIQEYSPHLGIILIGDDGPSAIYVKNKQMAAEKHGIECSVFRFPEIAGESQILETLEEIRGTDEINGVIVQLPLPEHIRLEKILQAIPYEKDVDGFSYENVGRLNTLNNPIFTSATPSGILRLLKEYKVDLNAKNVCVIGRSNIVGKPLSSLLTSNGATVTLCHSKTKNLKEHLEKSDIVISATGQAKLIKADMLKDDCILIDVGISRMDSGKISGDVDMTGIEEKCSMVAAVPGGVGPMTIASLLLNTVKAAIIQRESE